MLAIAIALLFAAVISWLALDIALTDLRWGALALAAALVPLSVTLTAAEYRFIAPSSNTAVGWRAAYRTTIVGTVANLLPIPGAAAVRVNDLVARRVTPARAAAATVATGLLWLGWALLLTGSALIYRRSWLIGPLLVAAGTIAVVLALMSAPRDQSGDRRGAPWLGTGSLIELSALAVGALRIWLTLLALGISSTIVQSLGLVAAGAIASTVGVVPGGLGVRELVAGLLAPLVDLEVAAAILTVAIVRVVGFVMTVPVAAILAKKADQ